MARMLDQTLALVHGDRTDEETPLQDLVALPKTLRQSDKRLSIGLTGHVGYFTQRSRGEIAKAP